MGALEISFDALRAEHAAIERKILPRLKTDDFIILDFELNTALLPTKTTMRLYEPIRIDTAIQAQPAWEGQMRSEGIND